MAPANQTGLVGDLEIWRNGGMIVPAIMTLICFVCTAVSLTVSGFICLRDREAQEESDNKAKHHKSQEFVSKVLGLFYKIRTSNIFRIQEIMQDLNDERPVWIGKKSEIMLNLEYYGIYLTERDKTHLSSAHEVFEIDCQSLFYFELERFSKAQAIYGPNVLKYFESIQQDGAAFPREFYPDNKAVFSSDIIYNVFTEMQVFTELFVLLATGMDLEIISVYSIPPQFKHSKLGYELSLIKDFLYNYYLRVFPQERSSASVMRKLPALPIIYEPIIDPAEADSTETIETIIEESEEVIEPRTRKSSIRNESPIRGGVKTPIVVAPPPPQTSTSSRRTSTTSTASMKPGGGGGKRRLSQSFGRQKLKLINAYKTIAERVRERPAYVGEEIEEDEAEDYVDPPVDLDASMESRQVRFRSDSGNAESSGYVPSPKREPQIRTKRKTIKTKITEKKPVPETEAQQEALLEEMRRKYKAPVRRENSARKRGRLFKEEVLTHNAFTYMVTRVIAFLQEKGHLKDDAINNTKYLEVHRSFII